MLEKSREFFGLSIKEESVKPSAWGINSKKGLNSKIALLSALRWQSFF